MKLSATLFTLFLICLSTAVEASSTGNRAVVSDFDGDGKTDYSVFRPSEGTWYIALQSGNYLYQNFGLSGDVLVPEDFDGDRKSDFAIWRDGTFYIQRSSDGTVYVQPFGVERDDPTICRDYDGDGKADLAVYRRAFGAQPNSYWYILQSSDSFVRVRQFGTYFHSAAPGDFDGDGRADIALFRSAVPANAPTRFEIISSSDDSLLQIDWGISDDIYVPGDYDSDGISDIAVWRPIQFIDGVFVLGTLYIKYSGGDVETAQWGLHTDLPVPGDYNGDGATDFAVWRSEDGTFYVRPKSDDPFYRQWGVFGDVPAASYQVDLDG